METFTKIIIYQFLNAAHIPGTVLIDTHSLSLTILSGKYDYCTILQIKSLAEVAH